MKSTTLIICDIYGLTPRILALRDTLGVSQHAIILDPYQHQLQSFQSESEAYRTFIDKCGHENYFTQTRQILKNGYRTKNSEDHNEHNTLTIDNIIAFSAGASAAYRAISEYPVKHCIGFYPSQIRHHLDLKPLCPTTLIFPTYEPHFDVAKVMKTVAECSPERQPVTCLQSSQNHGFMNPFSTGFSHHHANEFEQVFCRNDLSDYQLIEHQCREICQHDQQHHRDSISRL